MVYVFLGSKLAFGLTSALTNSSFRNWGDEIGVWYPDQSDCLFTIGNPFFPSWVTSLMQHVKDRFSFVLKTSENTLCFGHSPTWRQLTAGSCSFFAWKMEPFIFYHSPYAVQNAVEHINSLPKHPVASTQVITYYKNLLRRTCRHPPDFRLSIATHASHAKISPFSIPFMSTIYKS